MLRTWLDLNRIRRSRGSHSSLVPCFSKAHRLKLLLSGRAKTRAVRIGSFSIGKFVLQLVSDPSGLATPYTPWDHSNRRL